MRPKEGGRYVIVRRTRDGRAEDVTPAPFNARTRVHEYGGGSYLCDGGGTVYFTNFADQRLYRVREGRRPEAITPEEGYRFADFTVDKTHNSLIAVCEDHTTGRQYPTNSIAEVPLGGGKRRMLASGRDFYSNPRLTPDGARAGLARWNHPNMPWDGTELWVAECGADGELGKRAQGRRRRRRVDLPARVVAGRHALLRLDRTGWWNLYRMRRRQRRGARARWRRSSGGRSGSSGSRRTPSSRRNAFSARTRRTALGASPGSTPQRTTLDADRDAVYRLFSSPSPCRRPCAYSSRADRRLRRDLVVLDLDAQAQRLEVAATVAWTSRPGYIAAPEPIEFPTEGGLTAHALFYPPANSDYDGAGRRAPAARGPQPRRADAARVERR